MVDKSPYISLNLSLLMQTMADLQEVDAQGKSPLDLGTTTLSEHIPDSSPKPQWKAGKREYLIILTLVIVCVMASLDSSIFLPVLPVSLS